MTERVTVLKRLDAMSVAKIYAVFGALWGLFMGVMLALNIGAGASAMELGGLGALGVGIMGFILMIVIGVIVFFVMGLIMVFVYNVIANRIGGIEMTLDIKE